MVCMCQKHNIALKTHRTDVHGIIKVHRVMCKYYALDIVL